MARRQLLWAAFVKAVIRYEAWVSGRLLSLLIAWILVVVHHLGWLDILQKHPVELRELVAVVLIRPNLEELLLALIVALWLILRVRKGPS